MVAVDGPRLLSGWITLEFRSKQVLPSGPESSDRTDAASQIQRNERSNLPKENFWKAGYEIAVILAAMQHIVTQEADWRKQSPSLGDPVFPSRYLSDKGVQVIRVVDNFLEVENKRKEFMDHKNTVISILISGLDRCGRESME